MGAEPMVGGDGDQQRRGHRGGYPEALPAACRAGAGCEERLETRELLEVGGDAESVGQTLV